MKYIKYSIYSLLVVTLAFACSKPLPFETHDSYTKGGFARLLNTDNGTFFFTSPDESSFDFDVEYYSENNGAEIASHEWNVRHRNNVTGNISDPVVLITKEASSFGTNAKSGLPSASFGFSMNETLDALGITIDSVNGGDDLIFDGTIVMKDGRRFGPDNTDNSIQGGGGFDGIFRFVKSLKCTSTLAGVLDYATVGWCGTEDAGVTEWIADGDGVYRVINPANPDDAEADDFSFGAYQACYGGGTLPGGNLRIEDACNKLKPTGNSRWGEVYWYNSVSTDGPMLIIDWENDYGEGGVSTLTRQDGTDWPDLK